MGWSNAAGRLGLGARAVLLALATAVASAALATAVASAALAQTAAPEPLLQVRSFQVQGNSLLDAAALQAALAAHTGQRSLADLRQAAQAVQALYGQAGYAAVVVYLPPQPVADGVVTLNVVEGRIARIDVQGAQRLSAARVRATLPSLLLGSTPRVRHIDAELQIANENPGRSMGVLLAPGDGAGEVVATVQVQELPLQRFSLGLDNAGNARTGQYRLSLGWQHADLSGHDDQLSLQLQTSPTEASAVQVVSAAYRWPLVQRRAAIDLFAAYSDVDAGLQPTAAGDLRFAGRGRIAGARVVWYLPRWAEFDQRLSTTLEQRAYLNACSVAGAPACGAVGASVAVQPFTLEYAAQAGGPAPAALNVALSHNLALGARHGGAADVEAVRPGAKRRYTVLRASGLATLPVHDGALLSARFALQHSDDLLVPGEQFGLGGAASVRGYVDRELAGDSGWLLSLELASARLGSAELPVALLGDAADLRLLAFADAGQVRSGAGLACRPLAQRCTLSSLGLGLRLGWGPLQWRWFAAQALQDGNSSRRHSWRSHVALSASF